MLVLSCLYLDSHCSALMKKLSQKYNKLWPKKLFFFPPPVGGVEDVQLAEILIHQTIAAQPRYNLQVQYRFEQSPLKCSVVDPE